jgi:hypothetical protein
MQEQATEATSESQDPVVPQNTEIDPNQLRVRHAIINAKRKRKLPWASVAKRIGSDNSSLSQALNADQYGLTEGRRRLLGKVDKLFTRLERELT